MAWCLVFVAACGEVSVQSDAGGDAAPDAPLDAPAAAPGTVRWVRSLSAMQAYGIASGSSGLVLAGGITSPADLGGGLMIPVGGFDLVVAGFSLSGDHLYSIRHGDAASEFAFLQHNDSLGNPLVYGVHSSTGSANLGLGPFTPGGGTDGHIGRYGPGAPSWVQRISGPGEDKILATAPGPGSTVYGGGYFEGTTNFNNGTLTSAGGRDAFFARFNTFTGAVELTKVYPNTMRGEVSGLATNANTFIVAGMFEDSITFGGTAQPLTSATTVQPGSLDAFVAKVDATGTGVWAVKFGGTAGEERDVKVAVDAAGDVYIAGQFVGQVAFGAINLVGAGLSDVFVAKLHGADGTVAWAVQISSTGADAAQDLELDDAGNVAVSGYVGGAIDGGATQGGADAFIAEFDRMNGTPRFKKVISTSGDERCFGIDYAADGELYALVQLGGPFDFGVPLMGSAGPASVLVRIAP